MIRGYTARALRRGGDRSVVLAARDGRNVLRDLGHIWTGQGSLQIAV